VRSAVPLREDLAVRHVVDHQADLRRFELLLSAHLDDPALVVQDLAHDGLVEVLEHQRLLALIGHGLQVLDERAVLRVQAYRGREDPDAVEHALVELEQQVQQYDAFPGCSGRDEREASWDWWEWFAKGTVHCLGGAAVYVDLPVHFLFLITAPGSSAILRSSSYFIYVKMRQILVDSRDRTSGTAANFVIQLPETLTLETGHRGRVDGLRIPVCVPTISTATQFMTLVCSGVGYPIQIPVGDYDGPRLAATIQTKLSALPIAYTWTVVYDIHNISLSISATGPFTIDNRFFGAQLLSRAYTQTANSYNFTYCPLQGLDVAFLCCSNFTTLDTIGPAGTHDMLLACNFTKAYGSVEVFSMAPESWFSIPAGTYQQLQFQLRDRNNNVLDIVSNVIFTLCID
jgi:hypothetical protein